MIQYPNGYQGCTITYTNTYQAGGHVVFVRTLVYEVRTAAQSVTADGPEQMQVQVLVQVLKPLLLPEMVLLVELVPVLEQVPVSMPDPPVD